MQSASKREKILPEAGDTMHLSLRRMKLYCGAIACLTTLVARPAMAEILLYHGKVGIGYPSLNQAVTLLTNQGGTMSDTWWGGGAVASVQLAGDGLRLGAGASSAVSGSGRPEGFAVWRDIAFVGGSPPPVLRFDFEVHAEFGVDGIPFVDNDGNIGWGKQASLVISFDTGYADRTPNFSRPVQSALSSGGVLPLEVKLAAGKDFGGVSSDGNAQAFVGNGWDSTSLTWNSDHTELGFSGTFHGLVGYSSIDGGYYWQVSKDAYVNPGYFFTPGSTYATGANSGAFVDATHTLRLTAVTLEDGTPIDVTFDSGMRLSSTASVPEPSSILMMGSGLLSMIVLRWKRSQRS